MGTVLPRTREEVIAFVQQHSPIWTVKRDQIGLTEDQVTKLADELTTASDAFNAAESARLASKAATMDYHRAADTLRDSVAELVRIIKTFAVTSNNPGVYAIAQIPAPTPPGSLPAPKAPIDIKGSMDNNGVLTLRWKLPSDAPDSTGNFYAVERRLQDAQGVTGPWQSVGGNGRREFTDTTLPGCLTSAQYRIRTQRSTQSSPFSPTFSVIFGQGGGATLRFDGATNSVESNGGVVIRSAA